MSKIRKHPGGGKLDAIFEDRDILRPNAVYLSFLCSSLIGWVVLPSRSQLHIGFSFWPILTPYSPLVGLIYTINLSKILFQIIITTLCRKFGYLVRFWEIWVNLVNWRAMAGFDQSEDSIHSSPARRPNHNNKTIVTKKWKLVHYLIVFKVFFRLGK